MSSEDAFMVYNFSSVNNVKIRFEIYGHVPRLGDFDSKSE
jgi:hypothetical protein